MSGSERRDLHTKHADNLAAESLRLRGSPLMLRVRKGRVEGRGINH